MSSGIVNFGNTYEAIDHSYCSGDVVRVVEPFEEAAFAAEAGDLAHQASECLGEAFGQPLCPCGERVVGDHGWNGDEEAGKGREQRLADRRRQRTGGERAR